LVGTIIEDAVTVGVEAGDDVDGFARVSLKSNSQRKKIGGLEIAEQIEFVSTIIVRARPIKPRIIAVAGEIGDATGVVVGLAEGVWRLSGKEFCGLAAKDQFERIAFLVAVGFDLALLANGGVGARAVGCRRNRSIYVAGEEQINATSTDVGSAECAFGSDLALNAKAVLEDVRNAGARIQNNKAGGNALQIGGSDRIGTGFPAARGRK
jgi:hypothetical protein